MSDKMRVSIEHKWAHNTNPDRSLTVGNKHVRGFMIRHYATPIACKYPDKKDPTKGVVVFNNKTYSSRTSGFQSMIRRAIPSSWTTVQVYSDRFYRGDDYVSTKRRVASALAIMYEDQEKLVKELKTASPRISTRARLWTAISGKQASIAQVAKFLGRRPKGLKHFKIDCEALERETNTYHAAMNEKREARWAKRSEEHRKWQEARDAEMKLTREEKIAKWRNGESVYTGIHTYTRELDVDTMVRFSKDGRRVQTSRGVEITLKDALNAFKIARVCRATYKRDPALAAVNNAAIALDRPKIGLYTLEEISSEGDLRIGCHFLKYGEMERLFNQLSDEQKRGIEDVDVQS